MKAAERNIIIQAPTHDRIPMSRLEFNVADPRYKKDLAFKQKYVERLLVGLLSVFMKPSEKALSSSVTPGKTSILIVRHNAIGDAVVSSVLIQALRDRHPEASISVLASTKNAEAYAWIPGVSEIHVWPKRLSDRLRLVKKLRGRFDLVFQTLFDENFNSRTFSSRLIANKGRLIGPSRGTPVDGLYEHVVKLPVGSYVGKLLSLLEPLGFPSPRTLVDQFPSYNIELPEPFMAQAREFLHRQGLREREFVLLNLSAGAPLRSLSPDQTAEIAAALIAEGHKVVLSSAPADRLQATAVMARVPQLIQGEFTSLGHAMATVGMARLYVGPDTGTAHFAAAAKVPCLCIFPYEGRPDAWSPYGTAFIALQANLGETVHDLSTHQILALSKELLDDPACHSIRLSDPFNYQLHHGPAAVVIRDERMSALAARTS